MPQPLYGTGTTGETKRLTDLASQAGQGLGVAQGAQAGALGMYTDMAQGEGPSLAQQQMAAQNQQNIANQMSMAAQSRGGNLGAQARQASAAGAAASMGTQQQMAQLRAQEQQAAMQGMGNMANTMAGQSLQQQLGLEGLVQGANLGQMDAQLQNEMQKRQLEMQRRGQNMSMASDLIQSTQQFGLMSDERVKRDVAPGNIAASQAVAETPPQTFEYEPGYGEPGQRVGVMAQDLQRTPEGASIVRDTPYGKEVDVGGLASLATAASADQEQRLRALEAQLGAGRGPGLGQDAVDLSIAEGNDKASIEESLGIGPQRMTMDEIGQRLRYDNPRAGQLSAGQERSIRDQMMGGETNMAGDTMVARDPETGDPLDEYGRPMTADQMGLGQNRGRIFGWGG